MINSSIKRKLKRDGLLEAKPDLPSIKINKEPEENDKNIEKKDEEKKMSKNQSSSSSSEDDSDKKMAYSRKTYSKRDKKSRKRRKKSSEKIKGRLKVTVGKRKKVN